MVKSKRQKEERRGSKAEPNMDRRFKERKSGLSSYITLPEGIKIFNPKEDKQYTIDIMPTIAGKHNKFTDKGDPAAECTFFIHYGVLPGNGSHICLQKTYGKACPTCERQSKMKDDDPNAKELIKKLYPKERQLFLVRDLENDPKQLRIWEISPFNFGDFLDSTLKKIKDPEKAKKYRNFASLERGLSLELTSKGATMGTTNFLQFPSISFIARKKQYKADDIDGFPVLDQDCLVMPSAKEIEALYDSGEEEDDDTDAEDEPKKKKKKVKKEEEEEDEEESEDESNDEEESDEEEEDEDEDEEGEDEDDTPAKKKKKKVKDQKKTGKKKKPKEDEEEEEDDDEDSDDEDEEEDDAPIDDDDEEEDETEDEDESEEEEDEEEEKPVKKKKKK